MWPSDYTASLDLVYLSTLDTSPIPPHVLIRIFPSENREELQEVPVSWMLAAEQLSLHEDSKLFQHPTVGVHLALVHGSANSRTQQGQPAGLLLQQNAPRKFKPMITHANPNGQKQKVGCIRWTNCLLLHSCSQMPTRNTRSASAMVNSFTIPFSSLGPAAIAAKAGFNTKLLKTASLTLIAGTSPAPRVLKTEPFSRRRSRTFGTSQASTHVDKSMAIARPTTNSSTPWAGPCFQIKLRWSKAIETPENHVASTHLCAKPALRKTATFSVTNTAIVQVLHECMPPILVGCITGSTGKISGNPWRTLNKIWLAHQAEVAALHAKSSWKEFRQLMCQKKSAISNISTSKLPKSSPFIKCGSFRNPQHNPGFAS